MARFRLFSRRRRIGLALVALFFVWWQVATRLERSAIARQRQLPSAAGTLADRVDRDRLLATVTELASSAYAGRRTGTEGGRAARAFVTARFRALGLAAPSGGFEQPFKFVHHSLKGLLLPGRPYTTRYDDAANVLGTLAGRRAGARTIVVSAHYDHLGERGGRLHPGADDNASGVAVLLALAEQFVRQPPAHPLLFAAFDAEELGLRGARAFVAAPPLPLERIAVAVNLDMVSRNDRHELFASGPHRYPSLLPIVARAQRRSAVKILLGHDRPLWRAAGVEDWTQSSDHGAFHDVGVPFLYLGVEDHADYHRPTDTVDKIDPLFFDAVAETVVELLLELDSALAD